MQRALSAATVLALLAACAPDEGRYRLVLAWPGGAPPADLASLTGVLRVEVGPNLPGRLLAQSDPVPGVEGLQLDRVPNGDDRVAVVEIYQGAPESGDLRYFGLSDPFTAAPGREERVALRVPLRPPLASLGPDAFWLLVAGVEGGERLSTAEVEVMTTIDGDASSLDVANDPNFRIEAGAARVGLEAVALEPERCPPPPGTRRVCTYRIPWNLDQGLPAPCPEGENRCDRQIFVRKVDPYGYLSATSSRRVVVDRGAPFVIPGISGLTVPARGDILADGELARPGDRVRATLTVSETLAEDPVIVGDIPMTLTSSGAGPYIFEGRVPEEVVAGELQVRARLVDLAGNVGEAALATASGPLLVDGSRPHEPRVDLEGAVRFRRVPYGRDPAFGAESHQIVLAPQAVEESTFVVVEDAAGNELGRSSTAASGGEEVDIRLGDASEVFVRAVDPAGNSSARAQVRDVEWVINLRGKLQGDDAINPHDGYGSGEARFSLWQAEDGLGGALTTPELARLDAADGRMLELEVARRWVDGLTGQVEGVWQGTQLAADPIRGGVWRFADEDDEDLRPARWTGRRWRFASSPLERPSRLTAFSFFDRFRGQLVGRDAAFTFDGDAWRPNGAVPLGQHGALVHDPLRDRYLTFGGLPVQVLGGFGNPCTDLLLERRAAGAAWAVVDPIGAERPPARCGSRLVWHPIEQVVYLYGGTPVDPGGDNGAWRFDGARWQPVTEGPFFELPDGDLRFDPRARTWAVERSAAFGDESAERYRYENGRWRRLGPSRPPPDGSVSIYDPSRGVRFAVSRDSDGEAFELRAGTWRRVGPVTPHGYFASPSVRGIVTVLDVATGTQVFLSPNDYVDNSEGVRRINGMDAYDWVYDRGACFSTDPLARSGDDRYETNLCDPVLDEGPSARSDAMLADLPGPGVVMFGGSSDGERAFNELYRWTPGGPWTLLHDGSGTAPPPRAGFGGMVYDPVADRLVLFGGGQRRSDGDFNLLTDTWAWSDGRWVQLSAAHPQLASRVAETTSGQRLAFDARRGRVVLLDSDTRSLWELVDATWRAIEVVEPLPDPPSTERRLAFDPTRGRLVVTAYRTLDGSTASFELVGSAWRPIDATELVWNAQAPSFDPERGWLLASGGDQLLTSPDRPALVLAVDLARAQRRARLPLSAFRGLSVRAVGGGDGRAVAAPSGAQQPGVELAIWERDVGAWRTLDVNEAPAELPARVEADTDEASRYVLEDGIFVRVAPRGVDYGEVRGRLSVDYVEASIRYRLPLTCGNGLLDAGETCDDGNAASGDGCSEACEIEAGYECTPSFPSQCFRCGNGRVELGEECDFGPATADGESPGCTDQCVLDFVTRRVSTSSLALDGNSAPVPAGSARFDAGDFAPGARIAEVEVEVDLAKSLEVGCDELFAGFPEVGVSVLVDWSDLGLWLETPSGTLLDLVPVGGLGRSLFGADGLETTQGLRFRMSFDDDGLFTAFGAGPQDQVPYRPRDPFAALDGSEPEGEWTLYAVDERSPQPTCVFGFSVSIAAFVP